ncbi:hypothetical protein ACGFMM_34465 [Streptomyces sp. NPDC048604]|uniref:hypothetical protein n=1 Tax=Streptomyces sp. NPDC048604 TaxID=3365578 RepID=UPI0037115A62
MTQAEAEVDPGDTEAMAAYEEALRSFAFDLNKLHIQFGAPSYSQIVAASVRPKLTKAGVNEALCGKRLPSRESLLEFVRVVSSPAAPKTGAPAGHGASRRLMDHWRERWAEVKLLQRQAQAPWKRLRNTAKGVLEQALGEAEGVRRAVHEEADRVRTDARAEAGDILQAAHDEAARIIGTAVLRAGSIDAVQVDASDLSPERKQDGAAPPAVLLDWACPPPFWFAVPQARPLMPEDGGTEPLAELVPGTWYLAIERRGRELVARTEDVRRGILHDTSGLQPG